jgi:thioester reductase-like protein
MPTVVLTGFPGFLASALLPTLVSRLDKSTSVSCVIQSHYRALAEQRISESFAGRPPVNGRVQLIDGDITHGKLALDPEIHRGLCEETREMYHFAAIYDLAVPRSLGMKVNVQGTMNVLEFIKNCPQFRRLHYVSTCFVSGRLPGRYTENDLSRGQRFNNYYEETKYLAEVEVQNRMAAGMPATIYRPSIVVGDSRTGATQKYDGPYSALRWILKWKGIAPMVMVGDSTRHRINLVPRDFITNALGHLSGFEASCGKVYHLCDPTPPTVRQIFDVFSRATGRRILRIRLPATSSKFFLRHVPGVYRWMQILPEAVDYFTQPTEYSCENTLRDLQGTGIVCPAFADYAEALVRYVEAHPEIASKGLQ